MSFCCLLLVSLFHVILSNMDINSSEYIFAIELMTSVMELYCIKWKPNKSFYKNQSPFTPVVKKAVEYIWREKKEFIDDLFNTVIHMGTINMRNYKSAMEFASHLVTEAEYDEIELLRFCVIASAYASVFYLSGMKHVPNQCIKFIYNTIMCFRAKNQFTDESWRDIEVLGGAYSVEPPSKDDFLKSTSACVGQVSESSSSGNFLQIDAYSRNDEDSSKTLNHKSISQIQEGFEYLKENSIENESEKNPSKLLKRKNIKRKMKKSQCDHEKSAEPIVVNKQVLGRAVQQTFSNEKTTNVRKGFISNKFINLEGEGDHKAEHAFDVSNLKHAMSRIIKTTSNFTGNNEADVVNKYPKIITKRSEARNNLENKFPQLSTNVRTVDDYKGNEIISQTENTLEKINMIAYDTNKPDAIKQEVDEGSNFYNPSKFTSITTAHKKIKYAKIFDKNFKNKKYKFSKNKKFKSNKNTSCVDVYKGIAKSSYTTEKLEEKGSLSNVYSETSNTCLPTRIKNSVEDCLINKNTDTDKKVKGIKRKNSKRTKHKTKSGTVKTENVASKIKQLPKNVMENNVQLNSGEMISVKRELSYNKKVSEIKYVTETIKNVKCKVPISELNVIAKDVQRISNDKLKMANDDFEKMSETKDAFKEFSTDRDVTDRKETTHKNTKKIKLLKYEAHKFKGKSYVNKKVKRNKEQIKEERNIDALKDSVLTNTAFKNLLEEKCEIVDKFKKRKVNKNKSKKLKTKGKFKNVNSSKNVLLTQCTSDEDVDVETIEENMNAITKKRKLNTKSFKIAVKDRKYVDKFKRTTRQSTRGKIANCSVIDIAEENSQMSSTPNESHHSLKNSNSRSPGNEISNFINVSESEESKKVMRTFSGNFGCKMTKSKESENNDPKTL